jgi:hypothetical protein
MAKKYTLKRMKLINGWRITKSFLIPKLNNILLQKGKKMKKSGDYLLKISGEIFKLESCSLNFAKNSGTVATTGIYPDPRSPLLDEMINVEITIKLDISKKPFRIYCLDNNGHEIKKHEIIFWHAESGYFTGEHMNTGFIVSGFTDGDIASGGTALFISIIDFKFNHIEFNPFFSKSSSWMIPLKQKWAILKCEKFRSN